MASLLSKARDCLLDIFFPPLCLACLKYLSPPEKENKICAACRDSIILNTAFLCSICRARLPDNHFTCHRQSGFMLAAATDFKIPAVRNLIHCLKFKRLAFASKPLASLLISYLDTLAYSFADFIIIPIPLSKRRRRERGFNQSELLALAVAKHLSLPLCQNMSRQKETKPQSETRHRQEREQNVRNCFKLRQPQELNNKNVILVDDVYTTGSTAFEAVRTLKTAGVKKIIVLAVAST